MANQWLRLWHDMPTDPKWRTIAKASGQRIGDVMAVYCHLLVCASNATERGRTQSFSCEDVASAIDVETEQVAAIVDAMQGRVLDGDHVKGWEKRQVAREDGAAERAKAWREAKKTETNAAERNRTQTERNRTPDKDTDKSNTPHSPPRGSVVRSFPPGFDRLWDAYPKKKAKDAAAKAFAKRRPDEALLAVMLAAVAEQKNSREWLKDSGQFVPHLATWLNEGRWQDEEGIDSAGDIYAGAV